MSYVIGAHKSPESYPLPRGEDGLPNALAAKNLAPIGPSNEVFFDSPPISKRKSGLVQVVATINGSAGASSDDISIALRMDGGPAPAAGSLIIQTTPTPTIPAFTGTLAWVFTLPDLGPHTFGIDAQDVSEGGVITVDIGQASLTVIEL